MTTRRKTPNQLAPSFWRKVIRTKFSRNPVFDPGCCSDRLHGCPFLRGRCTFLCRGVSLRLCDSKKSLSVFVERRIAPSSAKQGKRLDTSYVIFPEAKQKQLACMTRQSLTLRGSGNCEGRTDGERCQVGSGVERTHLFPAYLSGRQHNSASI